MWMVVWIFSKSQLWTRVVVWPILRNTVRDTYHRFGHLPNLDWQSFCGASSMTCLFRPLLQFYRRTKLQHREGSIECKRIIRCANCDLVTNYIFSLCANLYFRLMVQVDDMSQRHFFSVVSNTRPFNKKKRILYDANYYFEVTYLGRGEFARQTISPKTSFWAEYE